MFVLHSFDFLTPKFRYEHCYPDESLMGQLGKIASRCHANTMERTCLHRYRVMLDLFLASGLNEDDPEWR